MTQKKEPQKYTVDLVLTFDQSYTKKSITELLVKHLRKVREIKKVTVRDVDFD